MEKLAREMLQQNPSLQLEFDKKKLSDTAFAKNAEEILNWFYERSPWWDIKLNVYPVGKIFDAKEVEQILKSK